MTHLAAVIVTYNRADRLRWTLDRSLAEPFDQVFVVNNASTDGTSKMLAQFDDPRLNIIWLGLFLGGALSCRFAALSNIGANL